MSAEKNATYVIGLHVSLLPSLSDCWIVCTCCDTADSIRSSSLLNSSKQPQAPTWHRPTKIRPMAWKKSVKKRDSEDYNRTGCRKRPSLSTTTVLFRTTFTRTIFLNHEKNDYCKDQIQAFVEQAVVKTRSQVLPPLGKFENLSYEFDWTFSVTRDYE